jgi:hypothetical protein
MKNLAILCGLAVIGNLFLTLVSASGDVLDPSTGLQWMNPSATVNMSFVDVSSQLAPGGEFYGYRYATYPEVRQFWVDEGLTNGTPELCTPNCFAEFYPRATVEALFTTLGLGNFVDPYVPGLFGRDDGRCESRLSYRRPFELLH